ncbi:hypothetical protein PCL_07425 [Purpureocillium lilacinum]|uniref:Uncharacterized protein n=1 Tax=Purpureocillium lilacinum TaxID=33203 RepID=A0A2U3DS96_PURLI|nr:hypothetical protein PCL_07425 [Purpureocillium lilacinum]
MVGSSEAPDGSESPRVFRQPEKGSIYDIIRGIPRRLRLRLPRNVTLADLGVHFGSQRRRDALHPGSTLGGPLNPARGHFHPSKTITALCDALSQMLSPKATKEQKSAGAAQALSILWPGAFRACTSSPTLDLSLGHDVHRDIIRVDILWSLPSDGRSINRTSSVGARKHLAGLHSPTPMGSKPSMPKICYINRNMSAMKIHGRSRAARGKNNIPVRELPHRRVRSPNAADPDHYTQLAAIFLAMAQRHFDDRQSILREGAPSAASFESVKLLIVTHEEIGPDESESDFIIYSAHVTAAFVARFYAPYKAPPEQKGGVPGLNINCCRVQVWPILGLRERLGTALGEDIVGTFDPVKIETWENSTHVGIGAGCQKQYTPGDCPAKRGPETRPDGETTGVRAAKRRMTD